MKWFLNLRLSRKLMLLASVQLLLTLLISATAMYQTQRLSGAMREVTSNWLPSVQALLTLARSTTELRVRENRRLLKASDPEWLQMAGTQIDEQLRKIVAEQAAYEKLISNDVERDLYDRYRASWDQYIACMQEVRKLTDAGKKDDAMALMLGKGLPAYTAVSEALKASVSLNQKGAAEEAAKVNKLGSQTLTLISAIAASALVIGFLLSVSVGRVIARPIENLVHAGEKLATGDFTVALPNTTKDETGSLVVAMTHIRDDLGRVIAEVRSSASSVATASSQIAVGTHDLSARTEQQAASLQETASAMEELSSTIRSAADVAQRTDAIARETSASAERAGAAVNQVVMTMQSIAEGSRRIKDIIGVIDGIAFQTNILALNAAVEAARAGEQGRGFAVVASEVRTLAQRSADAAREIKGLIDSANAQVEDGSAAASRAGAIAGQVVAEIANVRTLVSEISASAQQQSQGIMQVNEAVALIDQGTQQNAALVEQSSAAAASMKAQAERLAGTVSTFKVL